MRIEGNNDGWVKRLLTAYVKETTDATDNSSEIDWKEKVRQFLLQCFHFIELSNSNMTFCSSQYKLLKQECDQKDAAMKEKDSLIEELRKKISLSGTNKNNNKRVAEKEKEKSKEASSEKTPKLPAKRKEPEQPNMGEETKEDPSSEPSGKKQKKANNITTPGFRKIDLPDDTDDDSESEEDEANITLNNNSKDMEVKVEKFYEYMPLGEIGR